MTANASLLMPAVAFINPELVFSASSALMVPIYGTMALAPASKVVGRLIVDALKSPAHPYRRPPIQP